MRGVGSVRKSRIGKAIHLRFSFLKRRSELVITVLTRAVAANIGGAIIYVALSIDGHVKNKKKRTVKGLWQNHTTFTIYKISIVSLNLLSMVDSQLS